MLNSNKSLKITGAGGREFAITGICTLKRVLSLYFIPFFMNSPTGQTRQRIFTLDGTNDADLRNDVPFGGFVDIALYFGGEISRNSQFFGHE